MLVDILSRYQQLLGCGNVNLTNTTNYYARYTTSVICNVIVQNSVKPCSLSTTNARPLCAESCVSGNLGPLRVILTFNRPSKRLAKNKSPSTVNSVAIQVRII